MLKQENTLKPRKKDGKDKRNMKDRKPKTSTPVESGLVELASIVKGNLKGKKHRGLKSLQLDSPSDRTIEHPVKKLKSKNVDDKGHSQQHENSNDKISTSLLKKKREGKAKKKKRISESSDQLEGNKRKRTTESCDKFEGDQNVKEELESPKDALPKMKSKKRFIMKQLKSKRLEKGLIMLDQKSETKIYKLKKALQKKGLPEEGIREAINQERRKRELDFRHGKADVCYRCRKPGHRFAECPQVVQDNEQGIGVCFRCGSSEHILRECHLSKKKGGSLPFAKCFVCGVQGHLSRECSKNEHGAFPKGGVCHECGSKNHLKRDCPELNQSNEFVPTAQTIKAGASADTLDDSENSE